MSYDRPRPAQSIWGKISGEVRQSFPDALQLLLAQTEPPLKHKPGRSSGKLWFRTPDCSPAPSPKRVVVVFA
jgi:hypothetical protein